MAAACAHCSATALTQSEFEQHCNAAGLRIINGNLYGEQNNHAKVKVYRGLEERKGFSCGSCGKSYCMACLLSDAPPRTGGGKSCPACGGHFTRLV
jgi:hypothetical protein